MSMVAKFPGVCTACGGKFSAGTRIEWSKGAGARHVGCSAAKTASAASSAQTGGPRRREARVPKPTEAERIVYRKSNDKYDAGETTGTVLRLRNVAGGGGEDGHIWTVLASGKSPPNEDNGDFDWQVWHHVRPATREEAASKESAMVRAAMDRLAVAFGSLGPAIESRRAEDLLSGLATEEIGGQTERSIAIASWRDRGETVRVSAVRLADGRVGYARSTYSYDDARTIFAESVCREHADCLSNAELARACLLSRVA